VKKILLYKPDYAVHPGKTVLEMMCWKTAIAMLGGKNTKSAHKLSSQLQGIVTGRCNLTPAIIAKLEKWSEVPKSFWRNLQTNYQNHPTIKKGKKNDRKRNDR
jgi:plasmid maintenance system antidote protein VapI